MPARFVSAVARAVFVLAVARPALSSAAPDDARACIAAHADGQVYRDNGQLLAAREAFLACAVEACPSVVRKECSQLESEVEARIPTLVLGATGEQGRDLTAIGVAIDGRSVAQALDGSAIAVDPGEHRVRFTAPDGQTRELTIIAREAEKARRVVASFASERPLASEPPQEGGVPASVWVLGGVGAAALGSFAYFSLTARSTEECAPNCTRSEVDRIRSRYLAADVSLGVGLVSLGVATVVLLTSPRATSAAVRPARVSFAVAPSLSPGALGVAASGAF